ncbi:MAG: tetratricopeptide repeat protein [Spirochaetales bacterium]|nr:tetratricopeptide repeat protein [Spirochaetales bacterium]
MIENAAWLNDSAISLASDGFHKEAIASLRKALHMEPDNPVLWFNLALSCRALGQRDEARNALLQAARHNPGDVDILDTLAVVLHELGEDSAAEDYYQVALDIAPGNGRVWNNYGVLQFSQARYDEACKSFEKSVTLVPDFEDALYNLRDTYEELGKTSEMEKCAALLERRSFPHRGVSPS